MPKFPLIPTISMICKGVIFFCFVFTTLYLAIVDAKFGDQFSNADETCCGCGWCSTYRPTLAMAHASPLYLMVALGILMLHLGSSVTSSEGNVGMTIVLDSIAFGLSLIFFYWFLAAEWDIRGSLIYLAGVLIILVAVLDIGFQRFYRRRPGKQNAIVLPNSG